MVFSWRQFCLALTRAVKPGTKRKIQGMIAKSFAADVEKLHGAKSAANSPSAKTKLVEAKLDVVRAGCLLQHVGIVGRLCCFDRVDRVQRDEIHRRLQRRFDPGPGAPFCNRGSRIADQRGISSLWKYERERRLRGSEPVDSHFRPKWKRDHLRGSNQVARSMELFGSHRRDHKNASAYRSSPQPRSSRFAVTTSVQPAKKNFPSAQFFSEFSRGLSASRPDCFSASLWAQLSQPRFMSLRLKVKPVILPPRSRYS